MTKQTIIVIGAGPAGLMAAGFAAEAGQEVIILEKKSMPARKLLITGKGRCNLTNSANWTDFSKKIFPYQRFIEYALRSFFNTELVTFFNNLGLKTVEERGGRIFPESQKAADIVEVLLLWIKSKGVKLITNVSLLNIAASEHSSDFLLTLSRSLGSLTQTEKNILVAKACIIATGGLSYPKTGSTGDGYKFAQDFGHSIVATRPALVPLKTKGKFAQQMQGIALKNVEVSIWFDHKKQHKEFGELLFTHFGLSGPTILTLSRYVVNAMNAGKPVKVIIDLKPALDDKKLDQRLIQEFAQNNKKTLKNVLLNFLPKGMINTCLEMTGINSELQCSQIAADKRKKIRNWLKQLEFEVANYCSIDEAIITAGGVNTKEINSKTMASQKKAGLFFAGEVLDVDADTGGYNLQVAFSTGRLAGIAAANYILEQSVA